MRRDLRRTLLLTAQGRGLGKLISLHRRERPLIRFRASFGWLLLGGLAIGVPIAIAFDHDAIGVGLGLFAAHMLIFAIAGPVAARLFPPDGPPRWVALFDHGLIDVTGEELRVVPFDRVHGVHQDRGFTASDGRHFTAKSAVARLVADVNDAETVLDYHGYRNQDRFVDELRSRVAGGPSRSAKAAVRRGAVSHGDLIITRSGLSAPAGTLPWAEVGQVNERDDGTLSVYRKSASGAPTLWFSAVVPDTSAAAAMIVHQRNRAQG
jgi:hypothetical protein